MSTWFWFDGQAEDAASFRILGQDFNALNGGPQCQHSSATSFMVPCDDQTEIDRLWSALSEGGTRAYRGTATT